MSASAKAHSTVLRCVRQANPRDGHRRQRAIAWAVTAVILTGSTSLRQWINVVVTNAGGYMYLGHEPAKRLATGLDRRVKTDGMNAANWNLGTSSAVERSKCSAETVHLLQKAEMFMFGAGGVAG